MGTVVVNTSARTTGQKLLAWRIDAHVVDSINEGRLVGGRGVPYPDAYTHIPPPQIRDRRAVSPRLKTKPPVTNAVFHIRSVIYGPLLSVVDDALKSQGRRV